MCFSILLSLLSLITERGEWGEEKGKKRKGSAPGKGQERWVREEGKLLQGVTEDCERLAYREVLERKKRGQQ